MKRLLILILIICLSCAQNKKESNIKDVQIYFVEKGVSYPIKHRCELIDPNYDPSVFVHKIDDIEFLKKIEGFLKNLKTGNSNKSEIDSRIRVVINYKEGYNDILCLGENFDTVLNQTIMEDSPNLLKLIKEKVNYNSTFRTLDEVLGSEKKE